MRKFDKKIEEYLLDKGYFRREEQETTYKCSSHELKRYQSYGGAYPKEDPEGDAEFTDNIAKNVVDECTIEELTLIVKMETERHLRSIKYAAVSFIIFVLIPLVIYVIGIILDSGY